MKTARILAAVLLIGAALAPEGRAEPRLITLTTTAAAQPWTAVGRLNLGRSGFCTGALVAPDLVLTAAHCMFDRRSGGMIDPGQIEFLAGWRGGHAVAKRRARRIAVHPAYRYDASDRLERVSVDLALVELERPIRNAAVLPFRTHESPEPGDEVEIVSYTRDRAETPSLQDHCTVLGRDPRILVLNCEVSFGASGAPIFVMRRGEPMIASVVSAKARWRGRPVALGAALGPPLAEVLDALESAPARTAGLDGRPEGARFVRARE
ncbi:MAG: S1 family peptidase [Alphaproteobacteria bacterium]|nr:MAG: S1 family peptidase [Alphaproteobacteria bacterium]